MDLKPDIRYTVTMTQKELTLVCRSLGYMAGIQGIVPKAEDADEAELLNLTLLHQQEETLDTTLQQVRGKIKKLEE